MVVFVTICTDSGYNDGFSIFQFHFNKDNPQTNRYQQFEKLMKNTHVCATEFFGEYVHILNFDENLMLLNSHLAWDGSNKWLHDLVSVNNGKHTIINIPYSILKTYELQEFNIQAMFVNHDNFIIGTILVYWFVSDELEELDNIAFKSCHLVGGGPFYPAINMSKHNLQHYDNAVSNDCISKINPILLNKCCSNISYMGDMLHQIGFVCKEAKMKWNCDHKAQYALFGLPGATSNKPCPVCHIDKQQLWSPPTPESRTSSSRTFEQIYQSWISSTTDIQFNEHKANKQYIPMLVAGPISGGLAVLHIMQGGGGRLFRIIQERIRFGKISQQQQQNDISVSTDGREPSSDVDTWRNSLDKSDRLFCEIKQCEEAVEWLECKDNRDIFVNTNDDNFNEKIQQLKKKIMDCKQEHGDLQKLIQEIENKLFDQDSEMRFLRLCDKLNIKPWHLKDDSMIGPSVKKYLNKWHIVIDELKQFDRECARMMEPCLVRFNFIAKCLWTKNADFFNDECINYLKFNIIEFDMLYHKLIEKYGGGTGRRYGVKFHGLYHCYEWIEYRKWAPSWLDEQHLEAYNIFIRKFAVIYHCFGGHVNMKKMMNKIWRYFALN